MKSLDKLFDIQNLSLDRLALISNAGGHPRCLEYINKALLGSAKIDFQGSIRQVVDNLSHTYVSLATIKGTASYLLRPVILQSKLMIGQKLIPNVDLDFQTAISIGIYYNVFETGIPRMAPILLLLNLGYYDDDLKQQFINSIRGVQNSQFAGENFENFHSVWETLFRSLYDQKSMYLKDIYKSSKIITSPNFKDVELAVHKKYHIVSRILFRDDCDNLLKDILNGDENLLGEVINYGLNNPGFDILIPSLCSRKTKTIHLTLIEVRYSNPGNKSTRVDYLKIIMDKYKKCQESVNYFASLEAFKRSGMAIDWHYIHVAHRNVLSSVNMSDADRNNHSRNLPDNMMIVGKEGLLDLYGCLTEMAMFISDPEGIKNELLRK